MNPAKQSTPFYDEALGVAERESTWRSLTSFCVYRVVVAIILLVVLTSFNRQLILGGSQPAMALTVLGMYFVAGVSLLLLVVTRSPNVEFHPTLNVVVDVTFITLLMHASGGIRSGWGILLLVTLAAAGLISRGKLVLFHAAIAALAILIEQALQVLWYDALAAEFVQSGLLAGSYFAIAVLALTMANYARGAEEIAKARGVDLANLAQINELVIRDIQDGFVVVDTDGVVRQLNPQSVALVAGLGDASGKNLAVVAPSIATALQEWRGNPQRIFPMARDAVSGRDYQLRFVAVGTSATLVFLEDAGRIRHQAQQMKLVALGRLTASIAHEIRNPLSSINHAAELLQEDVSRNAADARLLTIIRDNAHRLDRMVQEVLYLNRRDRAHPESIVLKSYLDDFAREFCVNEKTAPETILVSVAPETRVRFDRSHLDQVLWNLTRNANRHGRGERGSIRISYQATAEGGSLDVNDDGPGVAAEALAHLFEPFFTTDADGTGLGLYIARELSEVNGASLECIVLPPGEGACFRLRLKAPKQEQEGGVIDVTA